MTQRKITRRQFAGTVGVGLGATVLDPGVLGSVAEASLPQGAPTDLIQLNSNENPFGPSPRALEAMTDAQAVAARYPRGARLDLVDDIARHHGVGPERIVLGCGSGEVLRMADAAFLGPERTLVAAHPTFEAVLRYAGVERAEAIKVSLTPEFRHDLSAMAAACDGRTGLVYVCNPNNPTGTLVGADELRAFIAKVPKSAVVLVDEAYHHFVEDPSYQSVVGWLDETPNLVVARTFSKVYGLAGMRLGYAICSPENAERLRPHRTSNNANAAVIAAGRASLADEEHVAEQRTLNNETRRWLCGELDKDGRRYIPSHTSFLMVHLGRDVGPVIEAFRAKKILVGRRFPPMDDWMRVSMGTRDEVRAFVEALRAIVPARH